MRRRSFGRTYTVEWTGGGNDNRFEIDLYYCGSVCMEVRVGYLMFAFAIKNCFMIPHALAKETKANTPISRILTLNAAF